MLLFELAQWKNIHERRRAATSSCTDTEATSPSPQPTHDTVVPGSIPSQPSTERGLEPTQLSTDPGLAPTQPAIDLSQHSLWSENVGDVSIVDTSSVHFEQPKPVIASGGDEPMTESQSTADAIARVKVERARKRCKPNSDHSSLDNSSSEDDTSVPFKINMNPRARKVGRPKIDKNMREIEKRTERNQILAAQEARRELGVVTLNDLADSIERTRPPVLEASRLLANVHVRFPSAPHHAAKYSRMKNPVLNVDAFYVLPTRLLNTCTAAFPNLHASSEHAIEIEDDPEPDSDALAASPSHDPDQDAGQDAGQDRGAESRGGQAQGGSARTSQDRRGANEGVEIVTIREVDTFSRDKIREMTRVAKMKEVFEGGVDTCKWLKETAMPVVPVYEQEAVKTTLQTIETTYPYDLLPGLDDAPFRGDFYHGILYRALPSTWLNDALVRAVCIHIQAAYPSVRSTGIVSSKPRPSRGRTAPPPETVCGKSSQ